MLMVKVVVAYCHELEHCVSIDDARREFFYLDENKRKRFNFSCSDRQCNALISGVNYHVKAEEGQKFKAAHFKTPHPHKHSLDCEWIKFTEEIELPTKREGESDAEFKERKARQKLNDWITHFNPTPDDDNQNIVDRPPNVNPAHLANTHINENRLDNKAPQKFSEYTRTNQLQRLINTWMDAKKNLSNEEFYSLNITIPIYRKIPLYKYITYIGKGLTNEYEGVIYGNARLRQRYEKGFLLDFYPTFENKKIELYVSKDIMNNSRLGHYVDEILKDEEADYFQVFMLNPTSEIRKNKYDKEVIQLKIENLRNFAIYLKIKQKKDV
ncbi:hypothetical protein ACAX46_004082 [Providencia rettgeri]